MNRIQLWVDLRAVPVNKRLPYLYAAEEAAVELVLLGKGDPHLERSGLRAVGLDARHVLREGKQEVGRWVRLTDARAVQRAGAVAGTVVAEPVADEVIPVENLVAARQGKGRTFAVAADPRAATRFAQALQTGVDGIVLVPANPAAIHATAAALANLRTAALRLAVPAPLGVAAPEAHPAAGSAAVRVPVDATPISPGIPVDPAPTRAGSLSRPIHPQLVPLRPNPGPPNVVRLEAAQVTSIEDTGLGDRVCVDTTSLLAPDEGLLVGSTCRSFALVLAETEPGTFLAPRPFRVNAGAVHSYVLAADGTTCYLSELAAGSHLTTTTLQGNRRQVTVGRVKVERRAHLLVRWRSADGTEGNLAAQDAETIRLATPTGPVPVTSLRPGDLVLIHREEAARHAGLPVAGALEER